MAALTAFLASAYPGSVVVVSGMPRTGKTTAAVEALPTVSRRAVAFSPYHKRDLLESRRGKLVRLFPGQYVTPSELLRHPELLDLDPLRLVVCPDRDPGDARLGRMFAAVADLCWETGDVDLWCDEAARYSRNAVEAANRLATGGGHVGMRMYLLTQSPQRLTIDVRRMVSHWATFALGSREDLDAVRARAGDQFAARVAALSGPPNPSAPLTWQLGQTESHQ